MWLDLATENHKSGLLGPVIWSHKIDHETGLLSPYALVFRTGCVAPLGTSARLAGPRRKLYPALDANGPEQTVYVTSLRRPAKDALRARLRRAAAVSSTEQT
jgi:hypothetical protein